MIAKYDRADNSVSCPKCGDKIDLRPYAISPYSHVRTCVQCKNGHTVTFIPDPDCWIISQEGMHLH